MQNYFKIGELAEMFDISIRALHLYDKMGLFKPEYTDESSGYRYYAPEQLQKLHTIVSLKNVGFSLAEIKNLYEKNLDPVCLAKAFRCKLNYFQQQLDIISYNIENIERMLKSAESQEERHEPTEKEQTYKMSRLVCLENYKYESTLSEVLWL